MLTGKSVETRNSLIHNEVYEHTVAELSCCKYNKTIFILPFRELHALSPLAVDVPWLFYLCCKCMKMWLRSWSLMPGLDTSTSSNALFSSSMAPVFTCEEVPSPLVAFAARVASPALS